MSNTQTQPRHLQTIAISFCLFSLTLCGVLFLSDAYVIPALTTVELNGEQRNVVGLREYKSRLSAEVASLSSARQELILPAEGDVYPLLKADRQDRIDVNTLWQAIMAAADEYRTDQQTVIMESVSYNSAAHTLTLTGDVRHVDFQSMTVLAQFTEQLRALPQVRTLTAPRFTRETSEDYGPHSPFTLTLSLQ